MSTIEKINREEKARVQFLQIKAKREANRLRVEPEGFINQPEMLRRQRKGLSAQVTLKGVMNYRDPLALGDTLRKRMISNALRIVRREEERRQCKVLVKNGKALTPDGEALLAGNPPLGAPPNG